MTALTRLTLALGLALTLTSASDAEAQVATTRHWWAQGAFGVVFPTGQYATTTNPGVGFGATVGYHFKPKWSVLGSLNLGLIQGDLGPDTNIYSYFLKLAYNIGDTGSRWRILVPLGAGGATFAPKSFESKTYFAATSGLMFQWYFNPRWAMTIDGLVTLVFTSQNEVGTDAVWLFPLAAGMLIRF